MADLTSDCLTVEQLRDLLTVQVSAGRGSLPVQLEGCDCVNAAVGLDHPVDFYQNGNWQSDDSYVLLRADVS